MHSFQFCIQHRSRVNTVKNYWNLQIQLENHGQSLLISRTSGLYSKLGIAKNCWTIYKDFFHSLVWWHYVAWLKRNITAITVERHFSSVSHKKRNSLFPCLNIAEQGEGERGKEAAEIKISGFSKTNIK